MTKITNFHHKAGAFRLQLTGLVAGAEAGALGAAITAQATADLAAVEAEREAMNARMNAEAADITATRDALLAKIAGL